MSITVKAYPVGQLETNCYLLTDGEGNAMLVDPGAEPDRLLHAVEESGSTLTTILLTHAHFDHIGAAAALQRRTGAAVYLHEADAPLLTDGMRNLSLAFARRACDPPHPDRLLRDGDVFSFGGSDFYVIHTPGHTEGSVCYHTDGILLSGDTLFAQSIGRTDFPGGDLRRMEESLARLAALQGDAAVYPGHGPESTLCYEKQHNPYLNDK